ncbi:MAG: hypothetical protein OEM97_01155 [Acidimicrobiia bacterium]|nr:hypothetical protein [Acidimicrobiia bacterium]
MFSNPSRSLVGWLLLLSLTAVACGSGGLLSGSEPIREDCGDIDLSDEATTKTAVHLTLEGPIVAREDNQPIRIIVDASYRRLHILQGYDAQDIADRMRWENDLESYAEFMAALEFEGFASCKGVPASVEPDGTGACPKNRRMVVELYEDGLQQMRLWWADCDGGTGTLAGKARTIEELFIAQIPNFDTLTDGIEF